MFTRITLWLRWVSRRFGGRLPDNPELVGAMHDVALADNDTTREALYKAFLKSELIAPGTSNSALKKPGRFVADEKTIVRVALTEISPGKFVLPVFSDKSTFVHFYGEKSPWISMPAPALFKSISNGNIAEVRINPFPIGKKMLKPGGILFKHEFELLADKLLPYLSTFNTEDRTAKLKDPEGVFDLQKAEAPREPLPGKVYFLIEEALRARPEVRAAYHFGVPVSGGSQRGIVGFQFFRSPRAEEIDSLMSAVGRKLREYPDGGFGLDMCTVTEKHLAALQKAVKPFYLAAKI